MKKEGFFLYLFLGIILLLGCEDGVDKMQAEATYHAYCGSCHLSPDPENIPWHIWEKSVMPEMATRMGYTYNQKAPLSIYSMEDNLFSEKRKIKQRDSSFIDSLAWQQILDYLRIHSPDSISKDRLRSKRNDQLEQFMPIPIFLDATQLGGITSVRYQAVNRQFMIGDAYGGFYQWPKAFDKRFRFNSPVMYHNQMEDVLFLTEVGYLDPSEEALGAIYKIRPGGIDTLAEELHRPVFTEVVDLNDDGENELIICEFGDLTGELSMLVNTDSGYVKNTLLALAGTIKVEIADMDNDGNDDIIVLASQGNEGIYILFQEDNLQFREEQVIGLKPEYGSSWFELIDYNGDQHLDIVLANGDNADYSIFLKPYHGIRLFLNDGGNNFAQKGFYPIYGATRVLVEDYDHDGDWDLAVMAYFPDFDHSPEESFVFLENEIPDEFSFKPYTFDSANSGRWLVMDDGDFDQDGDIDILLGSFLLPLDEKHKLMIDRWEREAVNLLLLENKTKD